MVLRSICLASKRVPSIRFRSGAAVATAGADSVTASAAAFTVSAQATNRAPAIEDWQLPARYSRKAFSQEEIDYINRGGPE